jgi:hypothetical protein
VRSILTATVAKTWQLSLQYLATEISPDDARTGHYWWCLHFTIVAGSVN